MQEQEKNKTKQNNQKQTHFHYQLAGSFKYHSSAKHDCNSGSWFPFYI